MELINNSDGDPVATTIVATPSAEPVRRELANDWLIGCVVPAVTACASLQPEEEKEPVAEEQKEAEGPEPVRADSACFLAGWCW